MATTYIKEIHAGTGGRSVRNTLARVLGYYENPAKTGQGRLISGHACEPGTAVDSFLLSRQLYRNTTGRVQPPARDVIAYKVRQAFKPGEITPEKANEIGYLLAMELTGGQCQFVVCTHVDRRHIHNHVVLNSIQLDCASKFRNVHNSSRVVGRLSDRLCRENGLSVIENPKEKGRSYREWQAAKGGRSWKERLRASLDALLPDCGSMEELLARMREAGYEVKLGRHIAFRAVGQQRFTRAKTLGAEYAEDALLRRLGGAARSQPDGHRRRPPERSAAPGRVNLLIDLENRVNRGKGEGFERWATVNNLKEASKTLNYLTAHGLNSYEALAAREEELTRRTAAMLAEIREREARLKELSVLRGHIVQYAKTRDVFTAWRASQFSGAFRAEHAQDLARYQEAVRAFEAREGGKLPRMQAIREECQKLKEEKEALYAEYLPLKQETRELQTVRRNVDSLLGAPARDRRDEPAR